MPALAADPSPSNLLRSATVLSPGSLVPHRLTDGILAAEGDRWNCEYAAVLTDSLSFVLFDLGETRAVTAVDLQADHDDEYVIEVGESREALTELWVAESVAAKGLRRRSGRDLDARGRYVRVSARGGDGRYSLGEVQVFTEVPSPWPPPLTVQRAERWWERKLRAERGNRDRMLLAALGLAFFLLLPRRTERRWAAGGAYALAVAMLGFASHRMVQQNFLPVAVVAANALIVLAFVIGAIVARRGREAAALWWRHAALLCVVVVGGSAWIGFGTFHSGRVVHYWDIFHYYVGSKYLAELGYDGLYEAALAAEYEEFGDSVLSNRKIRDLRTNELYAVAEPDVQRFRERCAARFSPERWQEFRGDVRAFRHHTGSVWWQDILMDHGYNGTPVATMTAGWLANTGTSSRGDPSALAARLLRLAATDFAWYAAAFGAIYWAFGLRVCALAVLVWGTGFPWAYYWTGGSFARVPWLILAVLSVCLLRRGYPLLAGAALAWSALLRIFPAALAGGALLKLVGDVVRGRGRLPSFASTEVRFALGGLLGVAVLVALSLATHGVERHIEFVSNTFKHGGTPLTNHMGLATIVSYQPDAVGRHLKDTSLADPWEPWKLERKDTLVERRWLRVAGIVGLFALLAAAGRHLAPWAVVATSTILIVGLFELTCYYYSFLLLLAPLVAERRRYVAAFLLLVIVGQAFQFVVAWDDELYIWQTIFVLVAVGYVLADLARAPLPIGSPAHADADGSG